jgi:hypothetical protein
MVLVPRCTLEVFGILPMSGFDSYIALKDLVSTSVQTTHSATVPVLGSRSWKICRYMTKEEAVACMRLGYRVGYKNNITRWMDRSGTCWLQDSCMRIVVPVARMADGGYSQMPFTHDDAHRWLTQGGWLSFGPASFSSDVEMERRWRYDHSGHLLCRLEWSSKWRPATLWRHVDDHFAPVEPDPIGPARTRFDIILEGL